MRFLRHDLHSLAGPYALDALEAGSERDRFTRHLSRCQSCASEVRGFREVATAMAFATAAEPPATERPETVAPDVTVPATVVIENGAGVGA